jgi:predicted metalloprotease
LVEQLPVAMRVYILTLRKTTSIEHLMACHGPHRYLLILFAVACGGDSPAGPEQPDPDPDRDGILTAVDACPNQAETLNNVWDDDGCPDTPKDLYLAARDDIEAYWAASFTTWQIFGSYLAISVFQDYTQPFDSPCGLLPLETAFYCPTNVGVYYDINFLDRWLGEIGDIAPVFVIAHEIGHHVGSSLGWIPNFIISQKESELQADCFAGVWTAAANTRGIVDSGDLRDAALALVYLGDTSTPWFDPGDHGTRSQRVTAFTIGFDEGAVGCTSQTFFDLFSAPGE